ncbi:MAG TPA: hypothetical protein VFZ79_15590 [Acidimicrobiales bacterium]
MTSGGNDGGGQDVAARATMGTRLVAAVLLAAAVILGVATPAGAKGPAGVTIQVPGGEPEALPAATHPGGVRDERLVLLAEDLGLWQAIDSRLPSTADPPVAPGPAFRLEWSLGGPDGEVRFVQTLHPQARGGPLVHTEPGQLAYGRPVAGGWFRASPRLADTLASLGWATKMSAAGGVVSDAATDGAAEGRTGTGAQRRGTAPGATGGATGPGSWLGRVTVAGGAIAVVWAAAGARSSRRRRGGGRRRDAVPTAG